MKYSALKATTFAALATVFALANASAQQPAPPLPSLAGSYTLDKVSDGNLPAVISEKDNCRQEITAAKLTVTAETKYTFESTYKETCGDKVQERIEKENGTLTTVEGKIQFVPEVPAAAPDKPAPPPAETILTGSSIVAESGGLKITTKSEKVLVFKKG